MPRYAFQCRGCGHLEEAGHAGDRAVPRGCRHCGKGVHPEIDSGGNVAWIDDPDNWIVLADLTPAELAPILGKFKHDASVVTRHDPRSKK